jgi:hypothetical protein
VTSATANEGTGNACISSSDSNSASARINPSSGASKTSTPNGGMLRRVLVSESAGRPEKASNSDYQRYVVVMSPGPPSSSGIF